MLRTAVIGAGVMGQNHARVLSEISQLMAIVDINEQSAKAVAKRFNVPHFKDYKELPKDIEAVVVATPTVTHKNIAIDLIQSGRHVLVEKPLAESVLSAAGEPRFA